MLSLGGRRCRFTRDDPNNFGSWYHGKVYVRAPVNVYEAAVDVSTPQGIHVQYRVARLRSDLFANVLSLADGYPAGRSFTFSYTPTGQLRSTQYPNGTFSWSQYDRAGQLTAVYNRHGTLPSPLPATVPGDASPIADTTYTFDLEGKRTTETRRSGGGPAQITVYGYDGLGRLTSADYPTGASQAFNYDLDSNRTSVSAAPAGGGSPTITSYAYDTAQTAGTDQLSSATKNGATTSYRYDSDGNLTSRGGDVLDWDARGRLQSGTFSGSPVRYTFDATGRVITRTGSGGATRYLYGADDTVAFALSAAGAISMSTIAGPAGPLAEYGGPPTLASPVRYRYYDGRGNRIADVEGGAATLISYGAFGESQSGDAPTDTRVEWWAGAAQKQLDITSGLIELGARQYDPVVGRFISVDPIDGGSATAYDYSYADPINRSDLSGMFSCLVTVSPVLRVRNPAPGILFKKTKWLLTAFGNISCHSKAPMIVSWYHCIVSANHPSVHCGGGFSAMFFRHHTDTHAFAACEDGSTDVYWAELYVVAGSAAAENDSKLVTGVPLLWKC